ncbi:MAG: hypothetical protein JKY89_06425 [Immundisolibacteraceae bacterium]|nr:hypothetical protein [Immundisolibacteraceae bacterium]
MRLLLMSIVVLGIGVGVSLWIGQDQGFLLLVWNGWRLEVSNLVVVVALLISFYLLLLRLMAWLAGRKLRLAQQSLGSGLIELAQGRWRKAEKKLLNRVGHSQAPLLNYLGAARAAQMAGDDQSRDRYLADALRLESTADKSSQIAVGLLRAESLHESGFSDQALQVLLSLQKLQPRHLHVLTLLQKIYTELDDWQGLLALVPQLRRSKLLTKEQSQQVSTKCRLELLQSASDIQDAWRQMPKKFTADARFLVYYLRILIEDGQNERAIKLLTRRLNKGLDQELLDLFGQIESGDLEARFVLIKKWLDKNPQQPGLLLAAGRLASKTGQREIAIGYYESLVETEPSALACSELAQLCIEQQNQGSAVKWLQQGLDLAVG